MKVRVTKCYLVQVLDKDGNELACEYNFSETKKEAEAEGRVLAETLKRGDEQDED